MSGERPRPAPDPVPGDTARAVTVDPPAGEFAVEPAAELPGER